MNEKIIEKAEEQLNIFEVAYEKNGEEIKFPFGTAGAVCTIRFSEKDVIFDLASEIKTDAVKFPKKTESIIEIVERLVSAMVMVKK